MTIIIKLMRMVFFTVHVTCIVYFFKYFSNINFNIYNIHIYFFKYLENVQVI